VLLTSNATKDLNSVHDHKIKAIINIENLTTIEELERFIQGNQAVAFTVLGDKNERYQFIQNNECRGQVLYFAYLLF
jgi:hypothetical protein